MIKYLNKHKHIYYYSKFFIKLIIKKNLNLIKNFYKIKSLNKIINLKNKSLNENHLFHL